MIPMNEIPDRFWSLFRSINRPVYIEALLRISEEYEYSNYFLSREMCIQVLGEYFSQKKYVLWEDETEDEWDSMEPPATRVLNWLLRAGWLRRVEDYTSMTANIVIPGYAAVMIDAFGRLSREEEDEAQVYIQNVYALLFSLKNDPRSGAGLLNTALVNTRRLNKSLQDMLHNMDRFFASMLEQKDYAGLLKEHLDGYVSEIVDRKYHILKTSDNFYLYKTDIKSWIASMREDTAWIQAICSKKGQSLSPEEAVEKLDQLERGFDDIERRIANMDREHSRYVKATVTRLNYLLNQEDDRKGMLIQLLNRLSEREDAQEKLSLVAERMNLSHMGTMSDQSLYTPRKQKPRSVQLPEDEEILPELSMDEVLNLNRVSSRYSSEEIEAFIGSHMKDGVMKVDADTVSSDQEFEKLILAYDYSTRRKSLYKAEAEGEELIQSNGYRYPRLSFIRRDG